MIDITKLSSIPYWLNPGPGDLSVPYLYFFLIFFGFILALKILLRLIGRQYIVGFHRSQQRIVYRVETLLLTMGLLGLLWSFFRFELVPYFSARYWLIVWLLGFVIWAYLIYHYARFEVPQILERDRERAQKIRYTTAKRR